MIKNQQNTKMLKSRKVKKVKKWQNAKTQKQEKWENEKVKKCEKRSKNDTPPKMAKMSLKWPKSTLCEIRAAWSGVFSIPGGTTWPGFKAEIRPPLFLHFSDHFWVIFVFYIFWFCHFLRFLKCVKLIKCHGSPFFDINRCNVIRPYWLYIKGDVWYVWWFSPLTVDLDLDSRAYFQLSGSYTGEEILFITLVLPSVLTGD